jgi:hypothetical protein
MHNKNKKWNAQQKQNFVRYGDIYQGEPYKNYRNVNIGPPVAIAQPQQQVAATLSSDRPTIPSASTSSSAIPASSRSTSTPAAAHCRYAATGAINTD